MLGDKMVEVYENYDMHVTNSGRIRGAYIFDSNKGITQLRPMDTGENRLKAEYEFKERLFGCGFTNVDRCVLNKDNELTTMDRYGNMFVMRTYFKGREMSVTNQEEINRAVENLAHFHSVGQKLWQEDKNLGRVITVRKEYDMAKRNRELKRVKGYILKQSPKRQFEETYLSLFDEYYKLAEECGQKMEVYTKNLSEEALNRHMGYCHGAYNNHNVLICQSDSGNLLATVGFDRFYIGNQLADLYYFARKIIEKNNYSFEILERLLQTYNQFITLSKADMEYIYLLFCYPEKFYKLSSQYINGAKTWISPKTQEKLSRLSSENEKKDKLLSNFENIFLHI